MNIIHVQQALKGNINVQRTLTAILSIVHNIIGVGAFEYTVVKTADIHGVKAGANIVALHNKDTNVFAFVTIGASNTDLLCVTDKMEELTRSFEYVMYVDKKIIGDKTLAEIFEQKDVSKDIVAVLEIIGNIANTARHGYLLPGNCGKISEDTATIVRYNGVVVSDLKDENNLDVETSVLGRRGMTHILKITPLLDSEIDVLKYLDSASINIAIASVFEAEDKGTYSNRRKKFNFATLIPESKLNAIDASELSKLGIKKEKEHLVVNTVEELSGILRLI